MSDSQAPSATLDELQQRWPELLGRLEKLETEKHNLQEENKALRHQLEKLIAHRQSSHSELVLLLTNLVSKLPLNDVGVIVARLVEHNTNVTQYLNALAKGTLDTHIEQPSLLKSYEQTKRDLAAEVKPLVAELIALDTPLEKQMLETIAADPGQFVSPQVVRAARCFFKGQVPRERVVRQFGPEALPFFTDLTTDPKFNPRPKADEIVLGFREDFDHCDCAALPAPKLQELRSLYQRVQQSKTGTDQARAQKSAFLRLAFILELLHYYEHQATENPEVAFAQRLPALIEQLVFSGPGEDLREELIAQAEALIAHIVNPDHRQMVINNIGKGAQAGTTLKFVLKLRTDKVPEMDQVIADFIRHLVAAPPEKPPGKQALLQILKLIHPDMRKRLLRALMTTDRMRRGEAESLAKSLATELGIQAIEPAATEALPPDVERQMAWNKIKDLIARRTDPAKVADAFRERLHAKYDADEIRQSWITLTEADPMSLIRVFCHLPYGSNGKTDTIARPVMETYVSRLMHEKYAGTYKKVVRSLHNMFSAKPDSPTLLNFTALVRWVDPESAKRLYADVGMQVPA